MTLLLCAVCCVFTHATVARKSFLMSVTARQYNENRILAALPTEDFKRLSPHLEPVELCLGQILYEAGSKIDYVYFPLNSMVSLISQLSDGSSVEIGVAGYEGMVGIYAVLSVDRTPHEGLVQVPGGARKDKRHCGRVRTGWRLTACPAALPANAAVTDEPDRRL